jgi:hypothetical protein
MKIGAMVNTVAEEKTEFIFHFSLCYMFNNENGLLHKYYCNLYATEHAGKSIRNEKSLFFTCARNAPYCISCTLTTLKAPINNIRFSSKPGAI